MRDAAQKFRRMPLGLQRIIRRAGAFNLDFGRFHFEWLPGIRRRNNLAGGQNCRAIAEMDNFVILLQVFPVEERSAGC